MIFCLVSIDLVYIYKKATSKVLRHQITHYMVVAFFVVGFSYIQIKILYKKIKRAGLFKIYRKLNKH